MSAIRKTNLALGRMLGIVLVALGLGGQPAWSAVEVTSVRTGVTPERTRIVLDLTDRVSFKVFTLSNPERVVIDLDDAGAVSALAFHAEQGGIVRGLRYARRAGTDLRVVLDVAHAVNVHTMQLGPQSNYGHRVVVDLAAVSLPAADGPPPVSITRPLRRAAALAGVSTGAAATDVAARVAPGELTNAPSSPVAAEQGTALLAAGDSAFAALLNDVELDVSGFIGVESRFFFQSPRFPSQARTTGAMSFQPEVYMTWDDDQQSLLFIPFVRLDQNDSRRTHFDLRELNYIFAADAWELRAGVRKVFWGVAESNHLVDIINQTDYVENIDWEDKLGQPMVNLALVGDWGTMDFFVLPGFRERTFPGREGRFQGPLRIVGDDAEYESAAGNKHVDYALRYTNYFGLFDVGLYHFWGTSREPRFGIKMTPAGEPVLYPIYDLIHQTGADVQATVDNWLFKFEALRRQGQGDTYVAAVGGFEYTFVGVFETAMDIGVLGEYHWDERGKASLTPFNDDLFIGSRLAFNDAADSQLLGGVLGDLNGGGAFLNVEASRRFGSYWKVELELRLLLDIPRNNVMYALNRDDLLQLEVLRYF